MKYTLRFDELDYYDVAYFSIYNENGCMYEYVQLEIVGKIKNINDKKIDEKILRSDFIKGLKGEDDVLMNKLKKQLKSFVSKKNSQEKHIEDMEYIKSMVNNFEIKFEFED